MADHVSAGIELVCDPTTESSVRDLWHRLDEAGIGSPAGDGHGQARPHLTAALTDWLEISVVRTALADLAWAPIRVELRYLGSFPAGALWLGPVVTPELLDRHRAIHRALDAAGIASHPYYLPGRWIPHCTVAMTVPTDRLAAASRIALDALPITGWLIGADLVRHTIPAAEYHPILRAP